MIKYFVAAALLSAWISLPVAAENSGANPVLRQEQDYFCRRTAPMELQGKISLWRERGAIPLYLNAPGSVMIPDWKGPDDVEVTVYLLHDDRFLYFGALVRDAGFQNQENSGQFYCGSGFQLAFDPLDDTIVPGYDGNDIELGFGKLRDGRDTAHCWVGGEALRAGENRDIKVKVTPAGTNQRLYEAAIPWTALKPFVPGPNRHFGFNVLYNAARDGKRRGWLHWTPGVGEGKLAFLFRNIRLVPAGTGQGEAAINLDKTQYSSGEKAIISLYLPTDRTGRGEAVFSVSDAARVLTTEKLAFSAEAGGTVLRFPYHIGRLRGAGLTVTATAAYPGGSAALTAEMQNLSPAILEAEADRLAGRNRAFRERLRAAAGSGVDITYPQVAAAVCDTTLKYRRLDLKKGDLIRKFALLPQIHRQFKQLDALLDQAGQELTDRQNRRLPELPVPRPAMANLVIRSGSFYSQDAPVIMIGPLGWGEVYNDLAWVAELGFNAVGGTLIAENVTPAPGRSRTDFAAGFDGRMKAMRKFNLAFDFLISPHPIPEGWKKAHSEMMQYQTGGWIKSSLYTPATREMIAAMWSNLLPLIRNNPNLVSLNLVNEWCFSDGLKTIHPVMLLKFRAAMKTRYGNIAALNRQWRTDYSGFDAIDPLALKGKSLGGFYDYERFRREEGLENLRFLRELAEKYAPGIACQVKTIAVTDLNPEQYTPVGVEREQRGQIMEIAGSDCAGTMELDYYRSVLPARPAADTEFHLARNTTPKEAVTDCWSAVLHGENMRLYYTWCPRYSAELLAAGAMLHNPPVLAALGRTALDIRRLVPEITVFQQAIFSAEVALLYSPASLYTESGYPSQLRQCHTLLSNLDAPVRFISERQLAAGDFARIKVLVIPGAWRLEPATAAALNRFATRGGRIWITGGSRFTDPFGAPLPSFPFTALEPTAANLDLVLGQGGVTRLVRNGSAKTGAPLELRSVALPDKILFYAINYGAPVDFSPVVDGRPLPAANELISGTEVRFPLRLETRQPMIFMVKR